MAPMAPLGRKRAMELVAEGRLPIHFGSPHPHVAIVEQDGKLRIRGLLIDEEEAKRDREAAFARNESWMPENYHALGKPTGRIYAEAPTRERLLEEMKTMKWPEDW